MRPTHRPDARFVPVVVGASSVSCAWPRRATAPSLFDHDQDTKRRRIVGDRPGRFVPVPSHCVWLPDVAVVNLGLNRSVVVVGEMSAARMWYYCDVSGQQQGPVADVVLVAEYAAGHVSDDCLIWSDALADWFAVVAHRPLRR